MSKIKKIHAKFLAFRHTTALVCLVSISATSNAQAPTSILTHCSAQEKVVFSCLLKNKKTVSLCASADLSKQEGNMQYRYGLLGKPLELQFPKLDQSPDSPRFDHPRSNFEWSSHYLKLLPNGSVLLSTNTEWSRAKLPPGYGVEFSIGFSPIDQDPSIHFVIETRTGAHENYQGGSLSVIQLVGKGSELTRHFCINEKMIDNLFQLSDVFKHD